ncbi:MAG: glycosyltransferase [Caulobacteraceae bacterium]
MTMGTLGMVVNHHHERRIGRKTANFLAAVHAHLRGRGIQLNIEFVLDRPDEATHRQIEMAARAIDGSKIHVVDFGNLGLSRTYGVYAARADVVCFVDGDDFFSMNWFEGALDYFAAGRREEVLHTQYMVGFDHEEFVRETMESSHPAFDPLALAVDWYWSANLAIQAEVFAATPIEPYDHAGGFGSEDWHWACNCLAAGIGRVSLPNTSYFYRVKPERYALGKVSDVIHMASPLFTRRGLPPPPPDPTAGPLPVAPLTPEFFAQARELERLELGVSFLRSVEVGGHAIPHFKPHTPPVVGVVLRGALEAGFGDGWVVVFADAQRLAGGLKTAAALCATLVGGAGERRLYFVEGDEAPHHARPDGYVISLAELRAANLYDSQIERLVARYFIQAGNLTVINLLSPRAASFALAYARATRSSVSRWINVVTEYGLDAFSQAFDELDLFRAAGLDSENVAVFAKTVEETWRTRGIALHHDEDLEADYVAGALGSRLVAPRPKPALNDPTLAAAASPAESRAFRITPERLAEASDGEARVPTILVDEALRALAEREEECILVSGGAFLGMEFGSGRPPRPPGLRIPSLTVVEQAGQPTYYVKHPVNLFNQRLASGRFPADLGATGALGVDCRSLREALRRFPKRLPLPAVIEACPRRAAQAGGAPVEIFASTSIVSVTATDLEIVNKSALARAMVARLAAGGVRAKG